MQPFLLHNVPAATTTIGRNALQRQKKGGFCSPRYRCSSNIRTPVLFLVTFTPKVHRELTDASELTQEPLCVSLPSDLREDDKDDEDV